MKYTYLLERSNRRCTAKGVEPFAVGTMVYHNGKAWKVAERKEV